MAKMVSVEISDKLYDYLSRKASREYRTLQDMIADMIISAISPKKQEEEKEFEDAFAG